MVPCSGIRLTWMRQLSSDNGAQLEHEKVTYDLIRRGYAVLRGAVERGLIAEYQRHVTTKLGELLRTVEIEPAGDIYSDFMRAREFYGQVEIQQELSKYLVYKEIHKRLFLQPRVLEALVYSIGPDLEYSSGADIAVNVKDVADDYLVKKFHQEFWSGAAVTTLQTWTPIAIKPDMGGLEIIEDSHCWGHVPHRNREPIEIPADAQHTTLDLEEGDMVIFHVLLLHRTVPNQHELPRFAVPLSVRNFYYKDTGFEDLQTWEGFHYSPVSQIRKRLGNPHLSPFRTYGSERTQLFR